jgi:hypothetical protein
MKQKFEVWENSNGTICFPTPNNERLPEIYGLQSKLLLRFEANDLGEAGRIKEKFLYEGNPDRLIPLNIPAERFFFSEYECGLRAGDVLRMIKPFQFSPNDNHSVKSYPSKAIFRVIDGDMEHPEFMWLKVEFDSGWEYFRVPDCLRAREHFRIVSTALPKNRK